MGITMPSSARSLSLNISSTLVPTGKQVAAIESNHLQLYQHLSSWQSNKPIRHILTYLKISCYKQLISISTNLGFIFWVDVSPPHMVTSQWRANLLLCSKNYVSIPSQPYCEIREKVSVTSNHLVTKCLGTEIGEIKRIYSIRTNSYNSPLPIIMATFYSTGRVDGCCCLQRMGTWVE